MQHDPLICRGKIIHSTREKTADLEDLIIRLESFPVKLFDKINLIDTEFLDNFTIEFATIIEEITERGEKSELHLAVEKE